MTRIAYVCYWNAYRVDGVSRKISAQTGRWRDAGHDVEIFALTAALAGEPQWGARPFPFAGPAARVAAATRLLRAVRRFRPDLVYLRYDLLAPPLQLLPRLYPTAVELNTDHRFEYRLRARRAALSAAYGRWNWRALLRPAAGIVAVTGELLELATPFRRPSLVLGNAVDLDGIEPLPPSTAERPTLAFSGTAGQAWHGIDKLLELAGLLPGLDFVVLGLEPGPGLPPNVEAHHFLPRAEYEPLFRRADAALGTAALHRKGMSQAAPLKVREYLAYGLPVIVPYEDPDLDGLDDAYVLRLPNEERNLVEHAREIESFVRGVRGRRVPREAVEARIGAEAKERSRLAFLQSLV